MLPMGKISPAVSRLLNVSRHTASLRGGILAFGARRTTPEGAVPASEKLSVKWRYIPAFAAAASAAALFMAALSHTAAQTAAGPTFRVSVNRVQISAVVTDARGQHVTDLGIADFTVLDEGEPQQLTSCEYIQLARAGPAAATAEPTQVPQPPRAATGDLTPERVRRTIVFLVDDESLAPEAIPVVREAIKGVIERRLQPGDLAALIRTGSGNGSLEQFTADRRVLLESCERVRWRPGSRGNPGALRQTSGFVFGEEMGGYIVVDSMERTGAALKYVISALRDLPGRKSIFFISQSLLFGRKYSLGGGATDVGKLVDSALRAGVVIYSIDPTPLSSLTPGADYDATRDRLAEAAQGGQEMLAEALGISRHPPTQPLAMRPLLTTNRAHALLELFRGSLRALAEGTGGMMAADTDATTAIDRFADDLQGYYLLVYKPRSPEKYFAASGSQAQPFRNIKVRVARAGMHTRTYAGYIAKADAVEPDSPRDAVSKALFSPFSASGIRLNMTSVFTEPKPGSPEINVLLHIDLGDLGFTAGEGGSHNAAFKVIARVAGERNEPAQMVTKEAALRLTDSNFQQAISEGFTYRFGVPAPRAGLYEVRVAIQDESSGKLGSAREFVEVPDVKNGRPGISGVLAYSASQRGGDPSAPGLAEWRVFRRQDNLAWACQLFNAKSFRAEAWILRDGKKVATAPSQVSESGDGATTATGLVPLAALAPGNYILKIVIGPLKSNEIAASQWTDFEVLP